MNNITQESLFGAVTTALISLPLASIIDTNTLQLAGTIFTAVYGTVINFTGSDEHKDKSFTQFIPVALRAVFVGGFTGLMAWAFCSNIGLGVYEKLLAGGAAGYAGDKGLKFFMSKYLPKENGDSSNE